MTASAWRGISVVGTSGAAPARPGHAQRQADHAAADRGGSGGLQSSLVSGNHDNGFCFAFSHACMVSMGSGGRLICFG